MRHFNWVSVKKLVSVTPEHQRTGPRLSGEEEDEELGRRIRNPD